MKEIFISFILVAMFCLSNLYADSTYVEGTITNATWTKNNSPYCVIGDINVASLEIKPGVTILFLGNYKFDITGKITAIGTEQDSIIFTKVDSISGWQGLYFNEIAPGSEIELCKIEGSLNRGIHIHNSNPVIKKCRIKSNYVHSSSHGGHPYIYGGGIYSNTTLELENCIIEGNYSSAYNSYGGCTAEGGGIFIDGSLELINCEVKNNSAKSSAQWGQPYGRGGGILVNNGNLYIKNTIIAYNSCRTTGGGIYIRNGKCEIINSTIAYNNPHGIGTDSDSTVIINSILYFNNNENDQIAGTVKATYCDIQNGYEGEGNIQYNPVFKSPQELIIVDGSPCVDAGNPDPLYNDVYFPPSLGTVRNDMGAHGGPTPIGIEPASEITVISPNGGEIWGIGITDTILWSSSNVTGDIKIDIYNKKINSWSTINGNVPNTGSYIWTPDSTYISDSCLLKISSISNAAIFDQSDFKFCIGRKGDVNFDGVVNEIDIQMIVDIILLLIIPTPCEFWAADCNDNGDINSADIQCAINIFLENAHIIVISPNGGEVWSTYVPQTIVWDPSIVASKVRLEISIDAGNNWITITDSTENDSSYSWTPTPDFISENCRIKITSINSDSIYDQSDYDFTISSSTHFKYKTTDESYSIVIDAATLDSISLALGDEIGVFTPAGLCVGASIWTGTVPLDLAAWRDDPQTPDSIDGYQSGEKMYFRVWDSSSGTTDDYEATPTYSVGNGTFGYSFYSRISLLEAFTSITQTIVLYQGWNWISFYVEPSDLNVETIFSQTTHLEILVNRAGKFYIPGVINGIGDLNILEGYKLFVSEDDTVTVTGQRVPFETPIPLSLGWNFIAYLPQVPIPIEIALGSIVSKLEIVKQDDGKFYVPNVINSIRDMAPGEGYKLYVNEACTLVYSVGSLVMSIHDKMSFVNSADTTVHFKFKDNTGESYSIVIDEATINGQIIEINDEIGVFTSDSLCVGASVFTGSFPIGLTAWKDDSQTSEVDGYITGDTMCFRIWDASENIEHSAIASYMSGDSTFESSFYSHISLLQAVTTSVDISTIDIPSEYFLSQNYPNPFNMETNIIFALPNDQNVVVKIYNIQGQLITTLEEGFKKAGIHKVNWNASNESSGIYICRFQAGRYSKILKLLLLK